MNLVNIIINFEVNALQASAIRKFLRKYFKPILPQYILDVRNKHNDKVFIGKTPREVFSIIYQNKLWGGTESDDFYSGSGSHDEKIVEAYVNALISFLEVFSSKPNVVDLGCGDFNVGRRVREYCNKYIACDVVPSLIIRNREKFSTLDVDFMCLDITSDALPVGDIALLRQVLQHLSNEQILHVINKLPGVFKFLVLTEHVPLKNDFLPNIDKPAGVGYRLDRGAESGVVLTADPFNLVAKSEYIICEIPEDGGLIRTTVYEFYN